MTQNMTIPPTSNQIYDVVKLYMKLNSIGLQIWDSVKLF